MNFTIKWGAIRKPDRREVQHPNVALDFENEARLEGVDQPLPNEWSFSVSVRHPEHETFVPGTVYCTDEAGTRVLHEALSRPHLRGLTIKEIRDSLRHDRTITIS